MTDRLRPLRQLRWKLTFSYTAVTVGALLVGELLLLACLIGGAAVLIQGDTFPRIVMNEMRRTLVPGALTYLEQTPPDTAGLERWMAGNSFPFQEQAAQGAASPSHTSDALLVVLDENGTLLAASGGQSGEPGRPFDPALLPGSDEIVRRALAGEADDRRLFAREPGRLLMAVPVRDSQEIVVGVLILDIPLQSDMLVSLQQNFGDLAALVGYSLACLIVVAGAIGTIFGFITARGLARRLKRLAEASDAWSQGEFSVFVEDRSADEIGLLSARLNRMAQQLQNLLDTRQELAVVEERNRLARDLHDSAKQQAFAASARLAAARAILPGDPQEAVRHLAEAEQLVNALRKELGALIAELRPAALADQGLASALTAYASEWSRQSGIQCVVRTQGERSLPLEVEQTLFRITQEALTNAARHSGAGRVEVWLGYQPEAIAMTIADDGRGFEVGRGPGGFGLSSMRDRARALGGDVEIRSSPTGTTITVRCPLKRQGPQGELSHD